MFVCLLDTSCLFRGMLAGWVHRIVGCILEILVGLIEDLVLFATRILRGGYILC